MKLIDDFFHIVSENKRESEYRCVIRLNPSHNLYTVHFPGNPVTPGVCLVQIAQEVLQKHLGRKLELYKARNMKFKLPVVPTGEHSVLFTKTVEEEGTLTTNVSIEDAENLYVVMTLKFRISE